MTFPDDDQARQWARELFADNEATEPARVSAVATPNLPGTGPVIPNQEKQPDTSQGPTAEQRYVSQLFNAGTIREYL